MRFKSVHRRFSSLLLYFSVFLLLFLLNPVLAQNAAQTVQAGLTHDGIPSLTDVKGMTLYTFANDKDGESICYDQCAQAWPPLTVGTGAQPGAGTGVSSKLGTTQRKDGALQVTYNGWPLYYFAQDTASGDAKGQGIGDLWFAASPATVMVSNQPGFGNILVGLGGLTLYVFLEDEVKDGQGSTYCTKECQATWPPLLVPAGVDPSAGAGVPGTLGVSDRNDGSHQVTYNGYPLYYFKQDEKPGDTKGNKAKDVWYVATPEEAYAEQPQVNTELIAQGLSAPVVLTSAHDDTGRLFIADQAGTIRILTKDGTLLDQPFLDLTGQILPLSPDYDERGLLGLAFHPDYATNGRFFVYYSVPLSSTAPAGWDHTNVVAEVDVSKDDPNKADLSTLRMILSVDQPQLNHNAGQIAFGPDGDLYIPIGDGGGGDDKDLGHTPGIGNGQDNTDLHGNILRIDVNGKLPYAIPPDNPFINVANTRPEIYAYGLRNPFHISFDSSGRLFAGDAGQELFEEVDIIQAGGNYGWHIREGNHCFDPQDTTVPPASCVTTGANGEPLINPILEFDHSKGVTVIGGYVYEGSALSDLTGDYIFGTYSLTDAPPNGLLFAAKQTGNQWEMQELKVANGEEGRLGAYVLSFGRDDTGELYVLTTEKGAPVGDTGKVWRLVPASANAAATSTPEMQAAGTAPAESTPAAAVPPSVTVAAYFTKDGVPTLVGPNGRTLYTLSKDDDGESTCYEGCAQAWPPLVVGDGGATANGAGIPGTFGTTDRTDGTRQVTYNGWPLYYFSGDQGPGDANGHGLEDLWFEANPATVMLSKGGDVLVGPGGRTLYRFKHDAVGESYCLGECTVVWSPLVVNAGVPVLAGVGVPGELGTIQRDDGLTQVTYNGMPLYFFHTDEIAGDLNGQGVKTVWFAVSPQATMTGAAPSAPSATSEASGAVTPEAPSSATSEASGAVTSEAASSATSEAPGATPTGASNTASKTPEAPVATEQSSGS